MVLRLNADCDAGPFIDKEKLVALFNLMSGQLPLNNTMQFVYQMMIDAAKPGSGEDIFNVIPGVFVKSPHALIVTGIDKVRIKKKKRISLHL